MLANEEIEHFNTIAFLEKQTRKCSLAMEEADLEFKVTMDLDIVLCIEGIAVFSAIPFLV